MNDTKWITDRKPGVEDGNDNGEVLATVKYGFMVIVQWDEMTGSWWRNGKELPESDVTAWMKLPDAYDERLEETK